MAISGIGTTGYPTAYAAKKTEDSKASENFASQMGNATGVQSANTGIVLHTSNEEDGEAIGAMADYNSSVTVYKTKDFDPENPIYKVKIWDADGNVTERMVDVSKVDPKNCDAIDMFAYSSHLTASGECPDAQSAFMGAKGNCSSSKDNFDLFDKENWLDIIRDIMQMQCNAGNIQGYLDYKKVWDFLEQ